MAISYHVYSNDGQGGAIDYTKVVATVPASSASPSGSFLAGPLGSPSDNSYAVRAFDDLSGVEEANTDARVRVVIDAQGRDVSAQPNPVVGLAVRWTVGETCLVSWGYTSSGQGGAPVRFDVSASPVATSANTGVVPPSTQSVFFLPGTAGYGCRLDGLATALDWTIGVRAVGASEAMTSPLASANLGRQSGALAPVDGLMATASA